MFIFSSSFLEKQYKNPPIPRVGIRGMSTRMCFARLVPRRDRSLIVCRHGLKPCDRWRRTFHCSAPSEQSQGQVLNFVIASALQVQGLLWYAWVSSSLPLNAPHTSATTKVSHSNELYSKPFKTFQNLSTNYQVIGRLYPQYIGYLAAYKINIWFVLLPNLLKPF